ncbi:MAG TPA: hypothetical protein VKE94_21165, partial [Gemmataceae bacterium]|nr:hypothetical protein [Gemmataceae bacterium]
MSSQRATFSAYSNYKPLYLRLTKRFSKVRVGSRGAPRLSGPSGDGPGYFVDCPFCKDTDGNLYIHHRYGACDSNLVTNGLDLAVCLRSDCLADPTNKATLAAYVFSNIVAVPRPRAGKYRTRGAIDELSAVEPPGEIVPLDCLEAGHPAIRYLTERNYDVHELATQWQVGYCAWAENSTMRGRIYIPVLRAGVLVGWQGRYVGKVPRGMEIPKYYIMPGMKKSNLLYNYDQARTQPLVVVCEGCSDVWRVGAPGVALFGKIASKAQLALFSEAWRDKPAVVLLDADAELDAGYLYEELSPFFSPRLVLARLPAGLDPGDCSRADLWKFLKASAAV